MLLKYFYDKALAHASYLVGCQKTGEALIIDPAREIGDYLDIATKEGMRIIGAAETHIHADYVSGARELAERVNAKLFVSDEGPADWKYAYVQQYDHQLLKEGDEFSVGNIQLQVIHTPGHTPESISFLLTDSGGGADKPMGLFTGDFVFVGSTGRPDLLEKAAGIKGSADAGAHDLYRSLQRFQALPDYLQIWPSHGAGSACGKGLGAVPSSTIGYEKMFNEALQFKTEADFVEYIQRDQPEAPKYFAIMKRVNKQGPVIIGDSPLPERQPIDTLLATIETHQVIDISAFKNFACRHVPGTLNVPPKYLASQAGWFIDYERPLYLIASQQDLPLANRILREIGVDTVVGYFDTNEVYQSDLATESYEVKAVEQLQTAILQGDVQLFDVRRKSEWEDGHIPQATYSFLGQLLEQVNQFNNATPIVLQCRTGERSSIAASILQMSGHKNVVNLSGGIEAWKRAGHPVEKSAPAVVG